MTYPEMIAAIILALFAAGGPMVTWINARAAKKPTITTEEAEVTSVEQLVQDVGVEERWKIYSDDIEKRLNLRIDNLEEDLRRTRQSLDTAVRYAEALRVHIQLGLGPPPPEWPQEPN